MTEHEGWGYEMADVISDTASKQQIVKDFLSTFLSSLSGKAFNFGLGIMLLEQTKSAMSFGINMMIYPLVSLLLLVPIGNLVDRLPHKKILILNLIFRIVTYLLFYLLYGLTSPQSILCLVIPFVAIHSASVNLNDTAYSTSVHELVNDRFIQKLSSYTQTAVAVATMISLAVGVLVYSVFDFTGFILMQVISNGCALLILSTMHFHYEERDSSSLETSQKKDGFHEIVVFLKNNKILQYILLVSVVLNFFYTAISIGVPFVLKERLHLGNEIIGLLETFSAIGMLTGSLGMSIFSGKRERQAILSFRIAVPLLALDLSIIALGLLFSTTKDGQVISLVESGLMGLIALSLVVLNIIVMSYLQTSISTQFLGRVMNTLFTLNTSIMLIGTLVFTYLFQVVTDSGFLFIVSGFLLLLYTGFLLPKIYHILQQ